MSFDFPAKLALAVLAAPDIPPEATDAVAEELGKLGAGMPAPRRIRTETRTGIEPTPVLRLFALRARPRGRWGAPGAPVDLPALRLAFDYGGRHVSAGSPHDPKYRDGDTIVTLRRDRAFENRAFDHLTALGPLPIDHLDMNFGRVRSPSTWPSRKMRRRACSRARATRSRSPPIRSRSLARQLADRDRSELALSPP